MIRSPFTKIVAVASTLLAPVVALAETPSIKVVNPAGPGETITLSGIALLVIDAANILIRTAVIITIGMIIYGGFQMATSRGDAKKFTAGQGTLINAAIGLAVILGVGIIVRTIGNFAVSPTSLLR